MKILLVSATMLEIAPLFNFFKIQPKDNTKIYTIDFFGSKIDILITGVGSVNTTYFFTEHMQRFVYDLVINIGFAGAFSQNLTIGEIVNVQSDGFGDLGIETDDKFYTIFDIHLAKENEFPFQKQRIIKDKNSFDIFFEDIKKVSAITVNTIAENPVEIKKRIQKFQADIETMEGAAFMFVAKMKKLNFLQIRVISNYVKPRPQAQWNKYKAQIALYEYVKMKILEITSNT